VPLLIEGFMREEVLLDHLMMQSARVSDCKAKKNHLSANKELQRQRCEHVQSKAESRNID
jgi:hypothetical protein